MAGGAKTAHRSTNLGDVAEAPGRRYDDVRVAGQRLELLLDRVAAQQQAMAQVGKLAELARVFGRL